MASAAALDEDYERSLVDELRDVVVKCRWQCLGHKQEFQGKTCTRIFSIDGEDVVLVYLPPDRFYAMDVTCPHAGGPLDMGDIEEIGGHTCLVCPWHDYNFRLDNGESTSGLQQAVHAVIVVDELVYINCRAELITSAETSDSLKDSQPPATDIGSSIKDSQPPATDIGSSMKDSQPPAMQDDDEAVEVGETHVDSASLCEVAVRILNESSAKEKVIFTRDTHQRWKGGDIVDIGSCKPPPMPCRDKSLNILQPGKIKRGKGGTLASRIAVLHSLANIEQWAIDLAWDIIARFSDVVLGDGSKLPQEFFTDFIQVADDEAKHFSLLERRLESLGSNFGALPVHNGLWQSAEETNDSLLGRLAVVHMVHEARGLDVHPKTQERFRRQSDAESVEVLDTIYKDEITHVAAGVKWFTYVCRHNSPPIDCIPKFHELVRAHFRGHLKPPFNEVGRETAGMSKEWYLPLVKS